jgi:peptidyl-prolyl cis-trans isomerase B (cyclophilin B)
MRILLSALAATAFLTLLPEAPDTVPVGRIRTDKGEILVYLYPETPRHQQSFIKLAGQHYWDSLTFNRVIRNFVAQGGCPDTPAGFKDSPYNLAPEFRPDIRHVYGALGAGHDGNAEKLSAGCQFYIVANQKGLPRLDDNYTVYGQVVKGMDVVEAIVSVPKDSADAPLTPLKLTVDVIQVSADDLKKLGFTPK